MKSEHYNIDGLILKKPDIRNFKLGSVFTLPKLKDLPREFCLPKRPIKNQGNSDKCTAYASCLASELQEGVELNPDFTFAVGKDIEGNPDSWGCDIESMLKAHTKVGAIETKDIPLNFVPNSTEARYLKNWSTDLMEKAYLNKKETYFQVKGEYDAFDDIRASIFKFKQAVIMGVVWSWGNKAYIDEIDDDGGGHCIHAIGWKVKNGKEYLIVPNSYGEGFGDEGYNYISREVVNHYVDMYGAYILVDMEREDAEWYINNKIKKDDNWLVQFFKIAMTKKLIDLLKSFFIIKQEELKVELKKKSMNEKLYELAKSKIGIDVSPRDIAPDDLACAESVSTLLNIVDPTIPVMTGTYVLWDFIKDDIRFERIYEPVAGCVVISPTGLGNGVLKNGHTGIYISDTEICSNSSYPDKNGVIGLWTQNYTRESWRARYYYKGGYPVYLFKFKS